MVGLSGLEKFSHLEDKIYRTIELTKTLRQENEGLQKDLALMRRDMGSVLNASKARLRSCWRSVRWSVLRLRRCSTQWPLWILRWPRNSANDGW